METEHRKEDKRFNNSQTPASFRTESVPKLDPCVLHMTHHPQRQAHGVFKEKEKQEKQHMYRYRCRCLVPECSSLTSRHEFLIKE